MVVRTGCMTNVFVDKRQRMHLIMGAVSLWTRPPALHLMCKALKKKPLLSNISRLERCLDHNPVVHQGGHDIITPKNCACGVSRLFTLCNLPLTKRDLMCLYTSCRLE